MDSQAFTPPGPGSWLRDATHMPRPASRQLCEVFPSRMTAGWRAGTAPYGALLDHMAYEFVEGWAFMQPTPVPQDQVPAQFAISATVWDRKPWREAMRRWDQEVKPASVRSHRGLLAVDLTSLDANGLVAHLQESYEHWGQMISQHHVFTVPAIVATGDFAAHVAEWTGRPPSIGLDLLRGASRISRGASDELDRFALELRGDADARRRLHDLVPAGELVAEWSRRGGAASAFVDFHGWRALGYDVGDAVTMELPDALVQSVRQAVEGEEKKVDGSAQASAVRDLVPARHREAFDALYGEALATYRLRDERDFYGDVWAAGVARRAALEAGRRLHLERPEHAAEATLSELRSLLLEGRGPSAEELAARARWRATADADEVPLYLGDPPHPPPPLDGLPPATARLERAIGTVIGSLFDVPPVIRLAKTVRGIAACAGVYEGPARVIRGTGEFGRLQKGDVLVTSSTGPAYNVLLPLLGAIVTDRGGLLSHAAIVAREYGIPAVVGTTEATKVLPDGGRVRVDGGAGEATLIG